MHLYCKIEFKYTIHDLSYRTDGNIWFERNVKIERKVKVDAVSWMKTESQNMYLNILVHRKTLRASIMAAIYRSISFNLEKSNLIQVFFRNGSVERSI